MNQTLRQSKAATQIRSTMIITLLIICSKALGYVRDATFMATFGLGKLSDAYAQATTLLSIFTLLFSAGVSSTFIPIYCRERAKNGMLAANRYANNVINLYGLLGIVVSIVAFFVLGSVQVLEVFFPPDVAALTAPLARILFPSLAVTAIWQVLINVLNANECFIPETLQGYILSICVIVACLRFGDIRSVTIATAIAPVFQLLTLFPFLRKRYKYSPKIHFSDPGLRRTFLLAVPALVSMAFDEVNNMADKMFTARMPEGSAATLNLCYTLVVLLQGVLVVPTTTVTYPRLSKYASEGNTAGIIGSIKRNTELLGFLLLPAIALMIVLRGELIGAMYQRGAFGSEDVNATLFPLAMYLIGVFGFGLRNFQTRVFYAMQKTRWPMILGFFTLIVNIGLSYVFKRTMGVAGLTLGTSIAGTLCAIMMLVVLRRILGPMQLTSTAKQILRMLLAVLVSVVGTVLLRNAWPLEMTSFLRRIAKLIACGGVGLAIYAVMSVLLRVEALRDIKTMIAARKKS